ncbi:MAG: lipid-A-disaccharide synthase [Pseudomonadota bacterium]
MAGLKALHPQVRFLGIGGPAMAREGLESLFPMDVLSVMGLAEVLPRLPDLLRRRDQAVAEIARTRPDALLTIDSPDFCLRVAARAKAARQDLPVIHYVAPSAWAWRPGRAERMAKTVDHVLALLPFEPPHLEAAGLSCDFVGHPIVAEPQATQADIDVFRADHDLSGPFALVLPGSRRGEVSRLLPVFGEALAQLPKDHRIVIPTLPHLQDAVQAAAGLWPGKPVVLIDPDQKRAAFAGARAALAASGSVSLELAASNTPMVIAYDMNWFSYRIISRMLNIDTVTLVNLIVGRKVVPEYLGPACKPGPIGAAFARLLIVPSEREKQAEAFAATMAALGAGGVPPGLRAARSTLSHLGLAGIQASG